MTPNVLLRDVTVEDLPKFFEHQLEPDAQYMAAFAPKQKEDFTAHWTKILSNDEIIKQTILIDVHAVGNIVCFEQFGAREIGYWIDKKYWGQGIATRALSLFLLKVIERPLFAHVAKRNIGSLRVLQKCGFEMFGEDMSIPNELGESVEEFVLQCVGAPRFDAGRDAGAPR